MTTCSITTKTLGPLTQQEEYEFRQLLVSMHELASTKPSSKRIVRNTVHAFEGRDITSWKCNEFLYKKDPCPLPTQARGLFTSPDGGEDKVVARGYNKFFNINEVSKTKWSWIEENTHGPYELTVKENGCLILAAGLSEGKTLLVTSKHAIHVPHAEVGRKWVERHVSQVGKTVEDFAAFLHANNATAVFELCDDEFEEHILEYPERTRGLYLHGINRNSVELDTWPSAEVTKVAQDFGFHVTKCFEFSSAEEGREFADKVRDDHVLDGRAIEGFVVRCQIHGSDKPFMFKIKYDEPYLMFREWREVTKRIMGDKPYRTTYPLSKHYVAWVKQQRKANPDEFSEFNQQKGIIGARKRFLDYYKQCGGSETELYEQMSGGTRVLLMPVASIGCGKTTVALALSRLFGFGHIQNDNINVKKNARGIFHKKILEEFENHNFVIADRNNHMPVLRQSLVEAMHADLVNCRVIALYWDHENAAPADILKHTMGRVISRGEAHQSLTPKRTSDFRGVMKGFVNKLVPLNLESESDNAIEDIIELDPLADSSVNLRTVIDALCKMFPDELKRPSEEDIDKALERALVYKPTVQKNVGSPNNKKEQKPLFFGLVPSQLKVDKWIEKTVGANSGAEWDVCRSMLSTGGHDRTYHITLAHMFSTNTLVAKTIYGGYMELFKKPELVDSTVVDCTADYIVCNDKVMALRVKSLAVDNSSKQLPGSIVKQAESSGKASAATVNLVPHITLAVAKGAKAVHSNEMLIQVFGSKNADVPVSLPDGWAVIPVALEFKAAYEKFTS